MAIENIILSDSLSTMRSIQNYFNPGDIASKIQTKKKAQKNGKPISTKCIPGYILYRNVKKRNIGRTNFSRHK